MYMHIPTPCLDIDVDTDPDIDIHVYVYTCIEEETLYNDCWVESGANKNKKDVNHFQHDVNAYVEVSDPIAMLRP